jgi:ABC-type phosphate transport system substrate-binding protein
MRAFLIIIAFALACPLTAFGSTLFAQTRPAAPAYRVIVHPDNPATAVDRSFLADAFLKKTTTWPDREKIRPVDLAPKSPVRRQFTEEVLRRSVEAVRVYWQQRIFTGRDLPPPELDTDEEVVKYVLKHEGAVGYVSGDADPQGTKILAIH